MHINGQKMMRLVEESVERPTSWYWHAKVSLSGANYLAIIQLSKDSIRFNLTNIVMLGWYLISTKFIKISITYSNYDFSQLYNYATLPFHIYLKF